MNKDLLMYSKVPGFVSHIYVCIYVVPILFLFFAGITCALAEDRPSSMESCLSNLLLSAPDDLTVGQMRNTCHETLETADNPDTSKTKPLAVDTRLKVEEDNVLRPFTIMAHKQNYFLLGAYNFQGYSPDEYREASSRDDINMDRTESQFQLSIKTPLAVDLFDMNIDIFAAYTVRSFWQLYNSDLSSIFRETNHEPEAWLQVYPNYELFGFKNIVTAFGINHQSNGQASNLSRSWNRIFLDFIFHNGNLAFSIKPWIRIPEDSENDDNPDITDYLGHGELGIGYKYKDHTLTFMSRNNLESGFSKGAVVFGWSFPLFKYPFLKGYVQYFSGYGESLIDYDRYVNKIGVGIMLTDVL